MRTCFEIRPKIAPNALLDRLARQIAFERQSFRTSKPQNGPRGCPGAPCEASWGDSGALLGALGRSWALLGRSWGALGRSWTALRPPLGALGAARDERCGALRAKRAPWAILAAFLNPGGSILVTPSLDFRPSAGQLSWRRLASGLRAACG